VDDPLLAGIVRAWLALTDEEFAGSMEVRPRRCIGVPSRGIPAHEVDEDAFAPNPRNPDGLARLCRPCKRKRDAMSEHDRRILHAA
jgi:hypothetical protein